MPNTDDAQRAATRVRAIMQRLQSELPDHQCERLPRFQDDPSVHGFRVDAPESGNPRYLLAVRVETLANLDVSEPDQLMDQQDTIARMKEAGMAGVKLRHPVREPSA